MKIFLISLVFLVLCGCGSISQSPPVSSASSAGSPAEETMSPNISADGAKEAEPTEEEIIRLCWDFLQTHPKMVSRAAVRTIKDIEHPTVVILKELPEQGRYLSVKKGQEPGGGPYYEVSFSTTDEAELGPITLLVNREKEVIGIYFRE